MRNSKPVSKWAWDINKREKKVKFKKKTDLKYKEIKRPKKVGVFNNLFSRWGKVFNGEK